MHILSAFALCVVVYSCVQTTPSRYRQLALNATREEYAHGETVCHQGSHADAMYVIDAGAVKFYQQGRFLRELTARPTIIHTNISIHYCAVCNMQHVSTRNDGWL